MAVKSESYFLAIFSSKPTGNPCSLRILNTDEKEEEEEPGRGQQQQQRQQEPFGEAPSEVPGQFSDDFVPFDPLQKVDEESGEDQQQQQQQPQQAQQHFSEKHEFEVSIWMMQA